MRLRRAVIPAAARAATAAMVGNILVALPCTWLFGYLGPAIGAATGAAPGSAGSSGCG